MQRVLRKSSPASDNQISQASLPIWAGALFSCRLSSFWQSAGLQNHRPLVRIRPPSLREGYYKTETPVPDSDTGVLGGRGWITQAAHLKRPRRGLFAAGTYSGGRCCSNPPLRRFTNFQIKQKLQCHYNTGVLGGAKQPKSEPLPSGASLAAISSKVMVFVPSL